MEYAQIVTYLSPHLGPDIFTRAHAIAKLLRLFRTLKIISPWALVVVMDLSLKSDECHHNNLTQVSGSALPKVIFQQASREKS